MVICSIFQLEDYIMYQSGLVLAEKNRYVIFNPWIFRNKKIRSTVSSLVMSECRSVRADAALCCDRSHDSVYRMIGLPQTCLYTGKYAGRFTIPTLSPLQRQYLFTCKVSRYCIFVPLGISLSRGCQKRTLTVIGHWRAVGPALKHYWINASCLLVYLSSDVIDLYNVCVIGQGRLYRLP